MISAFRTNSVCLLMIIVLFAIENISGKTLETSISLKLDKSQETDDSFQHANIFCDEYCQYPGTFDALYTITITGYHTVTLEYDMDEEERFYEIYFESSASSDVSVNVNVLPSVFFTRPPKETWTKKIKVHDYPFSRTLTINIGNRSNGSTILKLQFKKIGSIGSMISANIPNFVVIIFVSFLLITILASIVFSIYRCCFKIRSRETITHAPVINNSYQMIRYVVQPAIHPQHLANSPLAFRNPLLPVLQSSPIPTNFTPLNLSSNSVSLTVDPIMEELFPELIFEKIRDPFSQDKCSICLHHFNAGESCRQLYCKHIFHSSCIQEWLLPQLKKNNHASCPNCHQNFRKSYE